jgi:hypothetical protein
LGRSATEKKTYTYKRRTCGGGLDVEVFHPASFRNYHVWLLGRALVLLFRYSVATFVYEFYICAQSMWGRVGFGGIPSIVF